MKIIFVFLIFCFTSFGFQVKCITNRGSQWSGLDSRKTLTINKKYEVYGFNGAHGGMWFLIINDKNEWSLKPCEWFVLYKN